MPTEATLQLGLTVLAALYPLIFARLWRDGRISDRAVTIAAITWAPLSTIAYGLLGGLSADVLVLAGALLLPGLLLYRSLLGLIQKAER
jgi:tellurite resistance protein TehA-like permease